MDIAPDTLRAMDEKGIDLRDQFPKGLRQLGRASFDLVINMSGFDVPDTLGREVRAWDVEDPVFVKFEQHCKVRDQIEHLVMNLILELRRDPRPPEPRSGLARPRR
jgi:protein-tyrosine-phosphatase